MKNAELNEKTAYLKAISERLQASCKARSSSNGTNNLS